MIKTRFKKQSSVDDNSKKSSLQTPGFKISHQVTQISSTGKYSDTKTKKFSIKGDSKINTASFTDESIIPYVQGEEVR
jgi:hypothetical protein